MECLQEHLDDLAPDCQAAVGNFTEDEDEDISLDRILMKACAPMMKRFCEVSLKLWWLYLTSQICERKNAFKK